MHRSLKALIGLVLVMATPTAGLAQQTSAAGVYFGPLTAMGRGIVRSWVKLDKSGAPASAGLRITVSAMLSLPNRQRETLVELPIEMPEPYDHFAVIWRPRGFEPAETYGNGCFDFAFFLASAEERATITASSAAEGPTPTPAQHLPTGFTAAPVVEPGIGMRWFDPQAAEHSGETFTFAYSYGSYAERVSCILASASREFLSTHAAATLDVVQAQAYPDAGYYPQQLGISFDASTDEYVISLLDLAQR